MERYLILLVSLYALTIPARSSHIPFGSTVNASSASPENSPTVECDANYGVNLDIQDCRNAISQFNSGSELLPLADRDHIMPGDRDTLPLPFRMMGSKSFPSGFF